MLRTRHSPQQCLLWKHDMLPCATAPWQRVSVLFSLPRQKFGDSDVDMAKCGIGFTCRKGLKPESPNQDCHGSYSIYLPGGQDASNVARIYTQACGVRLVFGTMSSRGIPSIQLLDSYARSILLRLRFMMTKICNQKNWGQNLNLPEDSWFVLKMDSFSLYGVFDGHGQKGHDVSNFAMDMLPKCIIKDERCFTTRDWGPILIEAFKKTQNFITVSDKGKTIQAQMSGTTATVRALVLPPKFQFLKRCFWLQYQKSHEITLRNFDYNWKKGECLVHPRSLSMTIPTTPSP